MIRRDFLKIGTGAVGFVTSLSVGNIVQCHAPVRQTSLTDELGALAHARAQRVKALRAYVTAAKFPKNPDYLGQVPYFVDYEGTPCAVAYLMIQSGHQQAVDLISKANNQVRVMDVVDGPLVDWILTSGLTQEEAARIQPSYEFMKPEADRTRIRRHLNTVLKELETNTLTSLETAVSRRMPFIASQLPGASSSLFIVSPADQRNASLINLTSHPVSVRVTPLGDAGEPVEAQTRQSKLPSRGEYYLGSERAVAIDWTCEERVPSGAVRVIDSVISIW